jgi:MYXO-CTERM domain-containing protein
MAGDTVILMDGIYSTGLNIANSGTASAWITFKADDCSTPIIQGPGAGPMDDNQDTGVYSATATYVRFDGIVSQGWSTGFGNGWTGNVATDSNGNWDIENCIGDMNGRTGFTFFSATGLTLKHSIAAHNGSSQIHSWSSGVTLYSSPGGDVLEGNVSFENMDGQKHTDGSGFIADQSSDSASFVNNLAFGNGGSCLRMTLSKNIQFINNTCYHDSQDDADTSSTGPTDPDEVYFTNAPSDTVTITGISFINNVLVARGSGPGMKTSNYTPTSGWSNNVTSTGTVNYFTGADGTNPDFTIASGGTALVGKGTTGSGVPMDDVGFDSKCVTKKVPVMIGTMASGSWWQYSIDYDYIKSIGGVAKCFNPKTRTGTPDAGSYANGAVTRAPANTCTPPTTGSGGLGAGGGSSMGGSAGAGASAGMGAGGVATGGTGGMTSTGGTGSPTGGMTSVGGAQNMGAGGAATGGAATGGTGTGGTGTGGGTSSGGSSTTGGTSNGGTSNAGAPPASGGTGNTTNGTGGSFANDTTKTTSGCSCRVAGDSPDSASLAGLGLLGLGLFGWRRRRSQRH